MSTVTTLGVTGMTCHNCVSHVTTELHSVPGVENVSIELRVGETSEVTVFSDAPLDETALRDAIDEAGYDVASVAVLNDALAAQYAEQSDGRRATHACACGGAGHPGPDGAPRQKTYDLQVPPRA